MSQEYPAIIRSQSQIAYEKIGTATINEKIGTATIKKQTLPATTDNRVLGINDSKDLFSLYVLYDIVKQSEEVKKC